MRRWSRLEVILDARRIENFLAATVEPPRPADHPAELAISLGVVIVMVTATALGTVPLAIGGGRSRGQHAGGLREFAALVVREESLETASFEDRRDVLTPRAPVNGQRGAGPATGFGVQIARSSCAVTSGRC